MSQHESDRAKLLKEALKKLAQRKDIKKDAPTIPSTSTEESHVLENNDLYHWMEFFSIVKKKED